jgi:hypothetical protein
MPYITQERRNAIDREADPASVGELNYKITTLLQQHIDNFGMSYATINGLVGVLECAKLELYRRIAAPYENIKIEENGDVYK